MKKIGLFLFVPALMLVSGINRAQAETVVCTVIDSLPYTITTQGVYCLTGNLSTGITTGNAITIDTNNVVLDLNGFKIGGLAAGLGTTAVGIYASQRQNITIRNGIVRGFFHGIWLDDTTPFTTTKGNLVEDLHADQNTFIGIDVRGQGNIIRRNLVVSTGGNTSYTYAYGIYTFGPGNDILENRIAGTVHTTEGTSIYLSDGDGSVVANNRIMGDLSSTVAYGIYFWSSNGVLAVDNRITTADTGIYFNGSTGKYMGNLTSGVTTPFTGGTAVGTNN